jgi:hypothetical protein
MRFIPTRTQGVLDYLMGALLIVAPCILGLPLGTSASKEVEARR